MPSNRVLDRRFKYGPRVELPAWIASELPAGVRDREIATRGERMHVMEWGPERGHTIVLVHGNPTWGFLWRKVVAELRTRAPELRLVVPDLIGLGRSTKPAKPAHTLEHHGAWLGDMLDELVPGPLVLVAQDWGGPIGLYAMADRIARLRGLVLGNTAVSPPAPEFKPTLFHRLSQLPVASNVLFEWLGFPLGVLHTSQGDRSTMRGAVARAYRWPLRKRRDRAAPLALARMVPDSATAHPSLIALGRVDATFRSAAVPISLVWGTRDPILGRVINHLERLRPDAKIVRTGAGHFLQEEVPVELADAVIDVAGRADWS
jgi:haloalkane dehalogenase